MAGPRNRTLTKVIDWRPGAQVVDCAPRQLRRVSRSGNRGYADKRIPGLRGPQALLAEAPCPSCPSEQF
jgi:hypothetical protein